MTRTTKHQRLIYSLTLVALAVAVAPQAATATPTVPPPPTAQPAAQPTAVPPTATRPAPTATTTPVPPTATPVPATATPAVQATVAATKAAAASGDAKDVLTKALKSQMSSKPLHADVTTLTAGQTTQMTVEFVAPDSYHLLTSGSAAGSFEMIITGGKAYQKTGTTWQVLPLDVSSIISQITSDTSDAAINSISNIQTVGADVIDGAPMTVYTYSDTLTVGGQTVTSNVKVWIGVSDGLPHKAITDSTVAGVQTTTTELITYDPSIKIVAPAM